MRSIITITLLMAALPFYGQEKKDLVISLAVGGLNSPYYEHARAGNFYALDFDYHLSKKSILSAGYLAGNHKYYDDVLSNDPTYGLYDGTNSEARYNTFGVVFKYKILDYADFSLVPGAGLGIMTHTRNFPYTEGTSSSLRTSSWSDLVFPVTLDLNFALSHRWLLGLRGGFLIHPDYPILALHAGPRLSFVIP